MVFGIIVKPIVWIDLDDVVLRYELKIKGFGKSFFYKL